MGLVCGYGYGEGELEPLGEESAVRDMMVVRSQVRSGRCGIQAPVVVVVVVVLVRSSSNRTETTERRGVREKVRRDAIDGGRASAVADVARLEEGEASRIV
jgi:hypothetical protein